MQAQYAVSGIVSGAVALQTLLSLENPVDSNVNVILRRVRVQGLLAALASAPSYNIGRTTAAPTGGAILEATKMLTSEAAPMAVARSDSSATLVAPFASGTPGGTFGALLTGLLSPQPMTLFDGLMYLRAGEAVAIQATANLVSWKHYVTFEWTETGD